MRKSLILFALMFNATPVLAQGPVVQLPPELTDPATGQKLQRSIQAMSNALLDLRVGEMQAALEGRNATKAEKKLTVRDLERRNDPNFDRKVQQQIANVGPTIDRSIKAVNEALPAMLQGIEQAREAVERVTANMPDPSYPNR